MRSATCRTSRRSCFERPAGTLKTTAPGLIRGACKLNDRLLPVLDTGKVL
jgi:hypothetical protein